MFTNDPFELTDWAALLAVMLPFFVAAISGFWAVRVRAQENDRAEWRRIEELMQIVHNGAEKGLWAQQLAVDELLTMKRRRREVKHILEQAAQFFERTPTGGPTLAAHIRAKMDAS